MCLIRTRICSLIVLILWGASLPTAQAQIAQESNLTNFAFLNYYGAGTYTVGDQKVLVIRIPAAITLRSLEKYPWGLRAKLAFVFALQDFEDLGQIDFERYRVFTFVPGIEAMIPVGELFTLRPYFDLGVGIDEESKQLALITGLGMKTEFIFLHKKWRMSLEPGIQFSASRSLEGPAVNDDYSEVWLKGTARYPLWFKIGSSQPDAGVYAEAAHLFNPLEFASPTGETTKIRALYEFGVILGFQYPRPKILFVTIPSISVGYRFGADFKGLAIRFGGDLATPILR